MCFVSSLWIQPEVYLLWGNERLVHLQESARHPGIGQRRVHTRLAAVLKICAGDVGAGD
jgi:hypothetical protein